MNYIYINGTLVVEFINSADKDDFIENITSHTNNTWQVGRDLDEKRRDTEQGKSAEDIVELFMGEFPQFEYISYDKIRADNGKKHAPFDGLLYKKSKTSQEQIKTAIDKIRTDTTNSWSGQITVDTRTFLRNNHIHTIEIKSTKVSDKKRSGLSEIKDLFPDHTSLLNRIRKDDYFVYPHFLRTTNDGKVLTFEQYVKFVKDTGKILEDNNELFLKKLFEVECENASDIVIRVYEDNLLKNHYIIGYVLSKYILWKRNIAGMYSKKSMSALYYKLPLTEGKSVNLLFSDEEVWENFDVFKININDKPQSNVNSVIGLNEIKRCPKCGATLERRGMYLACPNWTRNGGTCTGYSIKAE